MGTLSVVVKLAASLKSCSYTLPNFYIGLFNISLKELTVKA